MEPLGAAHENRAEEAGLGRRSGGRYTTNSASDVANVVSMCKSNKLICLLENHDTTGYGEAAGPTAHSSGYGMFGWSWSGNCSDLSYLDQAQNFDGNSPTTWGSRVWFGTDGIYYISTQATVY
jgi:hypothetical protein